VMRNSERKDDHHGRHNGTREDPLPSLISTARRSGNGT